MSNFIKDIHNIALLARLKIDEAQAEILAPQLDGIVDMINQINSTDTADIQPMAHPLGFSQPLRADVVTETNQRDAFQQSAPNVEEGLYIVPKIIEV
jgi:aspartyl-tRNA(Asn)/glutamyl-tRNA(Gln) amidotransferase subunit C